MATKPYIIALEEHYLDAEVKRHFTGIDGRHAPRVLERLDDVGALRLKEMDEAGIDFQVLSHANPGLQKMDAGDRGAAGGRRQRPAPSDRPRPSRPLRRFCRDPDPRPEGGGRRTRADRHQARLQGRHGQRPDQRRLSRRSSGSGRSSSGRRRSTCRSTCIRRSRIRRSSKPITRITSTSTPRCCAPPGALPSRPRPRAFGWC